ncbi:MAG: hypothetical protein ACXQTR_03705 [Candidatus Methanospirareceae archaeon]
MAEIKGVKVYINLYDKWGNSVGAIELEPRLVDGLPKSGSRKGELVLNTQDSKLYFWDGSTWKKFAIDPHAHVRADITDFFDSPFWDNIPDKPDKFPPEAHTHPRSDITDFFASPFWDNIPDKPDKFPPEAHASTHVKGGADELSLDASQITSGVLDLARIPILDWSKLQFFGVRQEVLARFSDPKILIATSSMNLLLASADKVEYASGNITANSQELTIIGGTSTESGQSWVYWNLPYPATKVYVRVLMNLVDAGAMTIDLTNGDGSTLLNPPDLYQVSISVPQATADFRLIKNVGGEGTVIASEAVDLAYNTYYDIEFYTDRSTGLLETWRDGVKKFSVTDTDISSIASVRLRVYDGSTSEAQSGKYKGPVVIIYE